MRDRLAVASIERRLRALACALTLAAWPGLAAAQQPFVTDDVEVIPPRRFHLETSAHLDWLRPAALPTVRQGLLENDLILGGAGGLEVGTLVPLLLLVNETDAPATRAAGLGDLVLSVKKRFGPEDSAARHRFALSLSLSAPTGSRARGLGSGLWDFGGNGIWQVRLGAATTARANLAVLLAGNTLSGAEGIQDAKGVVYGGGASVTRQASERLLLGVELTGAYAPKATLGRSQLRLQLGGNYRLREGLTLDFGVLAGHFDASPRAGVQIGFSLDP